MLPLLISAAKGLASAAGKSLKNTKNNTNVKNVKDVKDVSGEDLRNRKDTKDTQDIDKKILQNQKEISTEQDTQKEELENILEDNKKLQNKTEAQINKTENRIESLEDKIQENEENKNDELVQVEKDQLEVQKQQLKVQKEQLEEQKEAEYRAEHHRKLTLKDKAKSMVVNTGKAVGSGIGKVANKAKENKGLLGKLMGAAAMIAMFWPQIKEKIGTFVEWVAEKIPGIIKSVWKKVKELGTTIMDMIIKYGPGLIKKAINGLGKVASSLLDGIIKYGPKVLTMLINGVKTLTEKVLKGIIEYGPKVGGMLWNGIKGLIKAVVPLLIKYVPIITKMVWNGIKTVVGETIEIIKKYGPTVWKMIKKGLSNAITFVVDTVKEYGPQVWKDFKAGLGKAITWVVDKASTFGEEMWIDIKKGFNNLVTLVKDKLSNLKAELSNYIYDATKGMVGTKTLSKDSQSELKKLKGQALRDVLENKYGIIDTGFGDDTIEDKEKLAKLPKEVIKELIKGKDFSKKDLKYLESLLKTQNNNVTNNTNISNNINNINNVNNVNPVAGMIQIQKNQYAEGGYTGDGDSKEVAGVVHYNEFVLSEEMLTEIKNAKDEGEKDALIKKAAKGKGKEAEEAIKKLLERSKPSGFRVEINGISVMLTNAQKEAYDKIGANTEDVYEAMDKEEDFIKSIKKGEWKDPKANKVQYKTVEKNKTAVKPAANTVTKNSGTTFTPEPVKVKPKIPAANDTSGKVPKKVSDIKETDVFKGTKIKNMNPDVKHNLLAMGYEYKEKFGQKLQLNSTGRSFKEQEKLYDDMLKKNHGRSDGSVAEPGTSMHNYGLAVDAQSNQLNIAEKSGIMAKYGFHRNVHKKNGKLETWHMEPSTLSSKDRGAIIRAGKTARKKGKDVDKLIENGEFTRGKIHKIQKVDVNGNPTNTNSTENNYKATEGPAAGNDVANMVIDKKPEWLNEEAAEVKVFAKTTEGDIAKEEWTNRFDIIPKREKEYSELLEKDKMAREKSQKNEDYNEKDILRDDIKKNIISKLERIKKTKDRIKEGLPPSNEDNELAEFLNDDKDGSGHLSVKELALKITKNLSSEDNEIAKKVYGNIDLNSDSSNSNSTFDKTSDKTIFGTEKRFKGELGADKAAKEQEANDKLIDEQIKELEKKNTPEAKELIKKLEGQKTSAIAKADVGSLSMAQNTLSEMGLLDADGNISLHTDSQKIDEMSAEERAKRLKDKTAKNAAAVGNAVTSITSNILPAGMGGKKVKGILDSGINKVKSFMSKKDENSKIKTSSDLIDKDSKNVKEDNKNSYIIKDGDTLSEIAKSNNTSVEKIMDINPNIKDKDKIFAGDNIILPNDTHTKVTKSQDKYVTEPGDTLSKIAKEKNISLTSLMTWNPKIKDPDKQLFGQEIKISGIKTKVQKKEVKNENKTKTMGDASKKIDSKNEVTKMASVKNTKSDASDKTIFGTEKRFKGELGATKAAEEQKAKDDFIDKQIKELEGQDTPEAKELIKKLEGQKTSLIEKADVGSLGFAQKTLSEMGLLDADGNISLHKDSEKIDEMSFSERKDRVGKKISGAMGSMVDNSASIIGNMLPAGMGGKTVTKYAKVGAEKIKGFGSASVDKAKEWGSKGLSAMTGMFKKKGDDTKGTNNTNNAAEITKPKAEEIPDETVSASIRNIDKTGNSIKNVANKPDVAVSNKRVKETPIDNATKQLASKTVDKKPEPAKKEEKQPQTIIMNTPAAPSKRVGLQDVKFREDPSFLIASGIL